MKHLEVVDFMASWWLLSEIEDAVKATGAEPFISSCHEKSRLAPMLWTKQKYCDALSLPGIRAPCAGPHELALLTFKKWFDGLSPKHTSVLATSLLSLTKAGGLSSHVIDQRVDVCLGQTQLRHPHLLVLLEQCGCDWILLN